jgi:hypothetical protein
MIPFILSALLAGAFFVTSETTITVCEVRLDSQGHTFEVCRECPVSGCIDGDFPPPPEREPTPELFPEAP